ncbi:MAG: DUF4175 family protein [Pseudomonadota bacterium]
MANLTHYSGVTNRIAKTLRRMRNIEVWRAYWPMFALITVFVAAAVLGVFEQASDQTAAFAVLVFLAGLLITALRGLKRYRSVSRERAIEALDAQSELRPITSLQDRPARPGPDNSDLWRAHQKRVFESIRTLSVPRFGEVWRKLDPLYLRFLAPLVLVGLFVSAGLQGPARIVSAFSPDFGSLLGADRVRIEAWITPPDYTGRAPILFKPDQNDARVPAGSVMTIRVQAPSSPQLITRSAGDRLKQPFEATPDGAYEISASIAGDTRVSIHWWGERRAWSIFASPDDPPSAIFVEVPLLGENDRTEFSWSVSDDYGVASLSLALRPAGQDMEDDLVAIDLGAVFPTEAESEAALDLTRHRYAGLRVEARLIAADGAGQTGISDPHVFILPEKLLLQPLAKAIQDVRVTILREDAPFEAADQNEDGLVQDALFASATQRLEQASDGIRRAVIMLEAITYEAPRYFEDILIYSGLRSAQHQLSVASSLEEAKALEPLLWGLALRAEYGTAADALAALQAARAALEEALRDGASEEEIRRLMEAFKDAAQNYLAARMAEALANGLEAPPSDMDSAQRGGSSMGGQDFADMLDALEDLTETGATDQARQLLADITNMLENLEFQQGQGSGQGLPGLPGEAGEDGEDLPEDERELSDTMRELSELLRQQRELNDETLAQQRGEGGQQTGPGGLGEGRENGEGFEDLPDWMDGEGGPSLAERQQRLGDLVEELARRQGEGGQAFGEDEDGASGLLDEDILEAIERAQRRAGRALEDGNEGRALRSQEQATRQLRELAEGLAEALDALRLERLGEAQDGQRGSADPFGRSSTGGIDDSNSVDIPDQIERQRARDILDELRRRFGETPSEDERDYLERLLDRF